MITADNAWAEGCDACKFGLIEAPSLEGAGNTWHARLVSFQTGELVFCDCRAGIAYFNFLKRLRDKLLKEAANSSMMQSQAARGSHPEMERRVDGEQRAYGSARAYRD